jgi:hypothetical protein
MLEQPYLLDVADWSIDLVTVSVGEKLGLAAWKRGLLRILQIEDEIVLPGILWADMHPKQIYRLLRIQVNELGTINQF